MLYKSGKNAKVGVIDGTRVLTTAGTRLTLVASSTPAKYVIITAKAANTGVMVVGAVTVVAAEATRQGDPLSPGEKLPMEVPGNDLVNIYIDSTVSLDEVVYIAWN